MTSRVTRSRARSETPQVTDFFKASKGTRTRGAKQIIEDDETQEMAKLHKAEKITAEAKQKKLIQETIEVKKPVEKKVEGPVASLFEKKASRTRARTPSRQAELSTSELTGTPPKKTRDVDPALPEENNVILDNPKKSAIEELMAASTKQKKSTIRTVADLQARLAEKGSVKALHSENVKNKAKMVDEHAESLKSPKKKLAEAPTKSTSKPKAARALFSPKKVPEYVLPGYNVMKSAEKIREEQDEAHDLEEKRMTFELLKASQLADEVKEMLKEPIQLPSSYENLADGFKCVDKIISILQGQKRSCMATELFKNVRNNSGKEFSEVQLAQILHVYPEAHKVEMTEIRKQYGQGKSWELTVKPNVHDDLRGYVPESSSADSEEVLPLVCPSKLLSPKKSPRKQTPALRQPDIDPRTRLDAARMRDRAYVFRYKLTKMVKESHELFLKKQGFPEMAIKRMHPAFLPNKHCPSIPQADLPQPPTMKGMEKLGMKDAIAHCMDVNDVKLPSFVSKALADLKSPLKSTTGASGTVPLSPKKFSEAKEGQKMSLLERIRQKAELKKAASACVDKDLETRLNRLDLLKQRYARIVCNRFTSKKVLTMKMDAVVEFIRFSAPTSQPFSETMENLKLLCEVAPMYVSESMSINEKHLRFADNNLDAIMELIEEEIQKTKEEMNAQKNAHLSQMQSPHTPRPKAARSLKFV